MLVSYIVFNLFSFIVSEFLIHAILLKFCNFIDKSYTYIFISLTYLNIFFFNKCK